MHIVGHALSNFERIAGAFTELFNLIFLYNYFFVSLSWSRRTFGNMEKRFCEAPLKSCLKFRLLDFVDKKKLENLKSSRVSMILKFIFMNRPLNH